MPASQQEMKASSAIIVALAFDAEQSRSMRIPRGFGFLVPQTSHTEIKLMAATFVDQKFSHRVPAGGTLLRGFFGGASATELLEQSDEQLIELARRELGSILGVLPPTRITLVRRWEDSLPQYAVGHLDRVAEMERAVGAQPNLRLAGNALYGVGIPDVIRQGRSAARSLIVI
jgi:oxygen-dependent protoporphyrinogen oxidase